VFKVALQRWVQANSDQTLVQTLRQSFAELRRVTADQKAGPR